MKLDPDKNIERNIKRSRENEIKSSSRYIINNGEKKFDENDIVPKFRNIIIYLVEIN